MRKCVQVGVCCLGWLLALWLSFALQSGPVVVRAADEQIPPASQPTGVLAQVVLTPTKDNTLYEDTNGAVSNGAGPSVFVGKIRTGLLRRGLLAFDLTNKIPATATITSVTLRLRVDRTVAGAHTVALHKVMTDWGEGISNAGGTGGNGATATPNDATWIHTFFNSKQWQKAGGDFVTTASASTNVGAGDTFTWGSTPELIADVQSWRNNPASNFGWILIGNEATTQTAKSFHSKESSAANQPQLTIVYESPATLNQRVYLPQIQSR